MRKICIQKKATKYIKNVTNYNFLYLTINSIRIYYNI